MKPEQVLKRFEAVKGKNALQKYELNQIRKYLQGNYDDSVQDGSTLRDEARLSSLDGSIKITSNRPFLTVQDNTALAAQDPQIDVPPKDDKSEAHALKLKKIHYATYEHSSGNWLMQQSTFYERAYGWSVIGAQPNLKERRVDLVTYDPRHCYPIFKLGSTVFLKELYVSWKASPDAIKDAYPTYKGSPDRPDEDVDMLFYHSADQKMTFAGDQLLSGVNDLGYDFCPFIVVPCMQTPDGFGIGDVHQSVGMAIAEDKLNSLMYQYIYQNVNAETAVFSDDEYEPKVDRGGRYHWHFSKDSKVEKMVDTSGRMLEGFRLASDLAENYGSLTGTGSARQGKREGMYVSAGGQAALAGPLGDRIDNSLKVKADRMSHVFEYALRLYEKHFYNTKLNLYGRLGKTPFEIGFKGKDIKNYYRTNVSFLPSILADKGNMLVQALQLNKAMLMSRYTTMNLIGIVDPEFETKQIEEERFAMAKLEGASQRTVQEATLEGAPGQMPPVDANPDSVPFEKLQLEKGRTNETAGGLFGGGMPSPASMPPSGGTPMGGGVPQGAMPMPGMPPAVGGMSPDLSSVQGMLPPAPGGGGLELLQGGAGLIDRGQIVEALQSIPKIRGKVYLVGAIMEVGNIDPSAQMLELMITNPLDKATLINGLRKAIPELDGRISVKTVSGVPKEENLDVTPSMGAQNATA